MILCLILLHPNSAHELVSVFNLLRPTIGIETAVDAASKSGADSRAARWRLCTVRRTRQKSTVRTRGPRGGGCGRRVELGEAAWRRNRNQIEGGEGH